MVVGRRECMRRFIILSFLLVCSCSRLPMKDFLGEWTVDAVDATILTEGGGYVTSDLGASPCFCVGEKMTFTKSTIIPCPSSVVNLKQYDEFPGTFAYRYDAEGSCITIPGVSYTSVVRIPETGYESVSTITIGEMIYAIKLHDGNTLYLHGVCEDDNSVMT